MCCRWLLLLLLGAGLLGCGGQPPGPDPLLLQPYDLLYASGVREYHRAQWRRAVPLLERSIRCRSALRRLRSRCEEHCAREAPIGGSPEPSRDPMPQLGFFQSLLSRADCLNHCLVPRMGPPSRHRVTADVQGEFQSRAPYNYLQVSYYKMDQLDKAAAAAETFHRANPDHLEMQDNLEMYRNMEGVKPGNFRDLEAVPHWEAYDEGTRLYQVEQFPQSIERLEAAVQEYLGGLAECRAQCEGPYDFREYSYLEYQSHLYETISDHYVQVLGCNQDCVLELATKPGRGSASPDFLPSHFNFLQYAYHKVGNYDKALECSRTFLLFHPNDHSVLQNQAFYQSKLGADRAAEILPREEIKSYVKQSLLEKELLYYVMDTLGVPFSDPDAWTPPELIPQSIHIRLKAEREEAQKVTVERETVPKETRAESQGDMDILKASSPLFANLKVAMVSEQLNGSHRAVLDGVLSHEECAALRRLANVAADSAKGYQGGPSPYPANDRIEGLTILRVLELASDGVVDRNGARLYYEASVRTQTIVQNYFQLKAPLHISFSHLLCRTAVTGHQENSGETSRAVHAQNCLLNPEAMACSKEPPADTARDFSAFLYLNDEFEGGDFFFNNQDAETISAEIEPKCGRLVTFKSGAENSHGVQGVSGGQRCAVSLWFTLDRQHSEKDRVRAERIMDQLFPPPPPSAGPVGTQPRASQPPTPSAPGGHLVPEARPKRAGAEHGQQKAKERKRTRKVSATEMERPRRDEL